MADKLPALVIAKPGQMRDGLRILLLGIAHIGSVSLAEPGLADFDAEQRPALVLLDLEGASETLQKTLPKVKAAWPGTLCIMLVEGEAERRAADHAGSDLVLIKGLLASRLAASVEEALARWAGAW